MSVITQLVSAILAAATAFSTTYVDPNMIPEVEPIESNIQYQIDEASQLAQGSGMAAGIVVIDRAQNNLMRTNDDAAHRRFTLESMGRLPILFHAARVDKKVGKGEVPEISAMMQANSGEATQKMWDKYGKTSIITDVSRRYNLQETESGNTWRETKSSAVDLGRMYRRFLDDKDVSIETKKYVITLLRETSLEVVGEDFSYGLPKALNVQDVKDNKNLSFVQGWSPSGSKPMVRATSGVVGGDMRFIVVVLGQMSDNNTTNGNANLTMTDVATTLTGQTSGGAAFTNDDNNNAELEKKVEVFQEKQQLLYGEKFVKRS